MFDVDVVEFNEIFELHEKADICQLGMDQRKVNMLAREYCDNLRKKYKPIILSHRILCNPGALVVRLLDRLIFSPFFYNLDER